MWEASDGISPVIQDDMASYPTSCVRGEDLEAPWLSVLNLLWTVCCHNSYSCFCKEHVNKPSEKYTSRFLWIKCSLLRLEELNHRICPNMTFISFCNIVYSVILFKIIDLVVIHFLLLQCAFHLKRTCLVQTDTVLLLCITLVVNVLYF